MKYLTLFILTILLQPSFGQNDLRGIVLDSVTNDPIPFASIILSDEIQATSDFDGKFQLGQLTESIVTLKVTGVGYPPKEFIVRSTADSLTLKLNPIPLDDPSHFIIWGKAKDTMYFENGKIQAIKYSGHDIEEFYQNGQSKFKSANGSTRSWYETGQLRSQSFLKNNHLRYETTWYSNGQKESEGTVYWGHNERKNEGEWYKNDDWNYWTKKGKKK
jgi:antitoxin component YwqK of YwqJK toxin-antitoxin module